MVKYFGNKNSYYEKPLPGEVEEYIDIINKYETNLNIEDIYMKICKPIKDEVEFINYMTMRFIAWDRESLRYFSSSEEIANMHITNINGTLLKNTVIPKGNKRYISEALYEDNDGYYTSKIAFSIEENQDGFKISSMVVTDKEPIFDFEVFDEISKPEFVSIYSINRVDEFLDIFYKDNPFVLKSDMENGTFFTRFNFDMYSNKQYNDDLDASYIYPRPYIDPMMYVNSSGMQMNPNTMGGYMTYMNPFMYNPFMYPNPIDSEEYDEEYNQDDMYIDIMQQQMQPMMPGMIPPNMMQMMMQMMMSGQMQPMPCMMMPGMTPMTPYMMMPGMTPINMEEFDEEEM